MRELDVGTGQVLLVSLPYLCHSSDHGESEKGEEKRRGQLLDMSGHALAFCHLPFRRVFPATVRTSLVASYPEEDIVRILAMNHDQNFDLFEKPEGEI